MRHFFLYTLLTLFYAGIVFSAEIVLVYPRYEGKETFIYKDDFDSTFVLGRIIPPSGDLFVNGHQICYSKVGAFLAYLPIRKRSETKSWNLYLINSSKDTLAKTEFPYTFTSDSTKSPNTSKDDQLLPKIVSVSTQNAHIKTSEKGSYFIFPEMRTKLKVIGQLNEFYEVEVANNLDGFIEKKSVATAQDDIIGETLIENGVCRVSKAEIICSFKIDKPLLWSSELSVSNQTLILTIYNAKSGIERIKYDTENTFIDDITWSQTSEGVVIKFRCNQPIYHGYTINCSSDSLVVNIKTAFGGNKLSLKGKTVVLDAGHGGSAKGSIGPMGTQEKDATLKWAKILAPMLEKQGAIVKLTRTDDRDLGLYDRIDFAEHENADFFLSLHFNALPDGENPYVRHGSGTYYYQSASRDAARIIHKHLLEKSKLQDDGLYDASLAVVRPTSYPAVLVEAAYIIYPNEEQLVSSESFLNDISKAMVDGLKAYFNQNP